MPQPLTLTIDFPRIRRNAQALRARLAPKNVRLYPVLKADAYGFGARAVAQRLADLADAFYLFDLNEAVNANLSDFKVRLLALDHPWQGTTLADYRAANVTPIVYSPERAALLRDLHPLLAIDTGMRRFGCDPADVPRALELGGITEAMTHASRPEQVDRLLEITAGRNLRLSAASTGLLDDDRHWLQGVRPGLALYRGALTVTTCLVETRNINGPAGYTGFTAPHIGVIPVGYTSGLRPGPCIVDDTPARVVEVGMQTSYIALEAAASPGSTVQLLGNRVSEHSLANAWSVSPQEVLVRFNRTRILAFPSQIKPIT